MKKLLLSVLVLLFSFSLQTSATYAVSVRGYYRSNGTYVAPYERTAPDGNPYNNYGFPGNYNPNKGTITGGNPDTYLKNYYNDTSGGSYSPSYSYPTTPTCPLNSYYDGISSCKCSYGYSVSGSSCVSNDSLCWSQTGYNSSYDSLTASCKCSYGNIIGSSGKCENASLYCSAKIGLMSQYNSLSKKCECMIGYEFNGSSCVYKSTTYSADTYSNSNTCPLNSYTSPVDSTKCLCDAGFQINSEKNACIITPIKTNDQTCQDSFGPYSNWDGTKNSDGHVDCNCQSGYQFNSTKTICLPIPPVISTSPVSVSNISGSVTDVPEAAASLTYNLAKGMQNGQVTKLQQILAKYPAIYPEGTVSGYFGPATERAVKQFQKKYNLEQLGYTGPKTRGLLNSLR